METLHASVISQLTQAIHPRDGKALLATSKTIRRNWKTHLAATEQLRNEAAREVVSVRSLAAFRQCVSRIQQQWPTGIRHELFTLLGATITSLDMSEWQAAIDDFLESTREYVSDEIRLEREGRQPSALTELFRAARQGPQALSSRQMEVCTAKGEPAMLNGGNAQEVARELGILPQRLEQITARKGGPRRPAGPAYRAIRESDDEFDEIIRRYGIVDQRITNALWETYHSPETAVARGKNVQRVALNARIRDRNHVLRLEQESVNGPAGKAVREGMSPEAAAERYGVINPFLVIRLKDIAKARDRARADAEAQQPLVQRLLRGAGNMIMRATRFAIESARTEPAHRTARNVMRGMPQELAGPSGGATYVANRVRQFTRDSTSRPLVDRDAEQRQRERALARMEREVQSLPRRDQPAGSDFSSDEDSE